MSREEVFSSNWLLDLLVAIGLHARCCGCFRIGCGDHRLCIRFVESGLDDLLFLRAEDLGQALVQLRLFLLEVWCGD